MDRGAISANLRAITCVGTGSRETRLVLRGHIERRELRRAGRGPAACRACLESVGSKPSPMC